MESKNNKTETEKRSRVPSSTTIDIFVDGDADGREAQQQQQQQQRRGTKKFSNPKTLADASSKYDTVQQNPQHVSRKKDWINKKKKSKKKDNSSTNTNKNNTDTNTNTNKRSNKNKNKKKLYPNNSHNHQNNGFILPGNFYSQQNLNVTGYSTNGLNILGGNGDTRVINTNTYDDWNSFNNDNDAAIASSSHSPPHSWINNIDENTRIDALLLHNNGTSEAFSIPEHVGISLLQHILNLKEKASNFEGEIMPLNHQAPAFLAHNPLPPHYHPQNPSHAYVMCERTMLQQPYNMNVTEGGSLPTYYSHPTDGNGLSIMGPPTEYSSNPPIMQYQHQQKHLQQYHYSHFSTSVMQPPEGLVIGIANPHTNQGTGDASGQDRIDLGCVGGHQPSDNYRSHHATPRRLGTDPAPRPSPTITGAGNLCQMIIEDNNNCNDAVTPYRSFATSPHASGDDDDAPGHDCVDPGRAGGDHHSNNYINHNKTPHYLVVDLNGEASLPPGSAIAGASNPHQMNLDDNNNSNDVTTPSHNVASLHAYGGADDTLGNNHIDREHVGEHHRSNNHGNHYLTPHRPGVDPNGETPPAPGSAIAGAGNLRQMILGNNNPNGAVTPYRDAGRGEDIPPRRVSISPMVHVRHSPIDDV
uniref:Uncharacterized protein n=1 Tax=Pseudo-nitzschia australis TaxID=44445 RepID=A0A7S4AH82_9STRA|mmetsp:Transcript_17932/g.39107  ORF Transcript_17932/g.39107 Transcript_17932/m.39107 type:complete len:640 (+) Transcript_17932:152-2071(+)|eukprot:CAMPEP_0168174526 /NCGR_PEP_ID=MMETSP0139_2-20121125/6556_1 /TAXON_ID=44445 /ORGANISM="Pseudo-nitzschia australis, Strain 10249 10 AB" /LENGTH=639 /DNA_ID=CAMNT_0008092693 /DNA_START=113 /DNA_END=2032 /DNA_ORIENTATION=+